VCIQHNSATPMPDVFGLFLKTVDKRLRYYNFKESSMQEKNVKIDDVKGKTGE
jgi:hypothetical protein